MKRAAKRIRGDVPNHRGNTAALRRMVRKARIAGNERPAYVPEAMNAAQLEAKKGWRLHPTKGWKRDRFYLTGDPSRPSHMEMVAVFYDTIRKAQGLESHPGYRPVA